MNRIRPIHLALLSVLLLPLISHANDLKAYYEQQKAELSSSFNPPAIGSELTIKLAGGQKRSGILMKLSNADLSLMGETGNMVYKRSMLHDDSKAELFAADFAHAKALEKTREYKKQLHVEGIKEEQANTHDGRISVSARINKKSDKQVEESERENKKNGETVTTTKTTRTDSATQQLGITVVNNTTHPDTFTVKWAVLAKPLSSVSTFIHDSGSQEVQLDARKRNRVQIEAEPIETEEVTISRASKDPKVTESGNEPAGYIVLLLHGNTLLDQKASTKSYLSEEWINKVR